MATPQGSTYKPNDSTFGCAYTDWLGSGLVQPMSDVERDELASCAAMLLNTPAYANDADLRAFAEALTEALNAALGQQS